MWEIKIPSSLVDSEINNTADISDASWKEDQKIDSILKSFFIERSSINEVVITSWNRIFYQENWKFSYFDLKFSIEEKDIENYQTWLLLKRFSEDESKLEAIDTMMNQEWNFNYSFEYKNVSLRANWSISEGRHFFRLRRIMNNIPTPKDLWVPDILTQKLRTYDSWWLIIVSAPTWEWKSTTIASIVQELMNEECLNIITLEDPKEYVYQWGKSVIEQFQIWFDTDSYMTWIKHVLRQNPDIVIIQEMTNDEIIRAVMHLVRKWIMVISSLHTADVPSVFESILNAHSEKDRAEILSLLKQNFKCVVSQRLIPKKNWKGRVAVFELLHNTIKSRGYLSPGWTINHLHQIMESDGNILFWKDIKDKIGVWDISAEDWINHCPPSRLRDLKMELWLHD